MPHHVLTRWSQENPVQSDVAVLRRLEAYERELLWGVRTVSAGRERLVPRACRADSI